MCSIHVTVQQAATVQRLIKPFMRIERKRVGEIEASEFFGCGDRGQSTVGAIDMHPQSVTAGDCRNFRERVDRARVDGAGGRDHGDRNLPFFFVLLDGLL